MTQTKPIFYLSLDQVRDSGLLSPERMAEIEAEIERRISVPLTVDGQRIETARVADLSPWPRLLYTRMDHDPNWMYIRREILAVVLTPEEREFLDKHALSAVAKARDAKRFAEATKVKDVDWLGGVFFGDDYFASIDELYDKWAELVRYDEMGFNDHPAYVWAAREQRVIHELTVADVYENHIDDWGWEDMGAEDLDGVAELQAALDAFAKANEKIVSYVPDYRTAVLIGDDLTERLAGVECNRTGIDPIHQR